MADAPITQNTVDTFDPHAYMRRKNEADQARREGKPVPEIPKPEGKARDPRTNASGALHSPVPAAGGEKAAGDDGTRDGIHLATRSATRKLTAAEREASEERGRRKQLEELIAKGIIKPGELPEGNNAGQPIPKAEPKRADFANDGEYYKAISKFYADKAAEGLEQKFTEKQNATAENEQFANTVRQATAKMESDITERFSDWDAKLQKAKDSAEKRKADSEDGLDPLRIDPKDHGMLHALLLQSNQRASILYHWVDNPESLQDILAMEDGSHAQIEAFWELAGEVKTLYAKKQEKKPEVKQTPAAAADAKLAKPSEAVAVRGGEGVNGPPSMLLADGRTLNPAWKTYRNEKEGRRR